MSSSHESPGTRAAMPWGCQAGREWESGWSGKHLKFDSENPSLGLGSVTVTYWVCVKLALCLSFLIRKMGSINNNKDIYSS